MSQNNIQELIIIDNIDSQKITPNQPNQMLSIPTDNSNTIPITGSIDTKINSCNNFNPTTKPNTNLNLIKLKPQKILNNNIYINNNNMKKLTLASQSQKVILLSKIEEKQKFLNQLFDQEAKVDEYNNRNKNLKLNYSKKKVPPKKTTIIPNKSENINQISRKNLCLSPQLRLDSPIKPKNIIGNEVEDVCTKIYTVRKEKKTRNKNNNKSNNFIGHMTPNLQNTNRTNKNINNNCNTIDTTDRNKNNIKIIGNFIEDNNITNMNTNYFLHNNINVKNRKYMNKFISSYLYAPTHCHQNFKTVGTDTDSVVNTKRSNTYEGNQKNPDLLVDGLGIDDIRQLQKIYYHMDENDFYDYFENEEERPLVTDEGNNYYGYNCYASRNKIFNHPRLYLLDKKEIKKNRLPPIKVPKEAGEKDILSLLPDFQGIMRERKKNLVGMYLRLKDHKTNNFKYK